MAFFIGRFLVSKMIRKPTMPINAPFQTLILAYWPIYRLPINTTLLSMAVAAFSEGTWHLDPLVILAVSQHCLKPTASA